MGKTLYGKYIDDFGEIGVNLPLCVVCKLFVSEKLSFSSYNISCLPLGVEEKGEYYWKGLLKLNVTGLVKWGRI